MKEKKDIFLCLFSGITSIFTFCIIVHIWNMDLSIPFVYAGDLSGLLNLVHSVIRKESWWHFDGLGTPFYTNMWRQMMDGVLPNILIFHIAKIFKGAGYGINLYYIASYGLSSMCSYYMLRKSNIEQVYSLVGAVLYALIPGHFLRNEGHLYVGSCFAIPLIIVTAINLYSGKMCKTEYISNNKLSAKELFISNSKEQNIGIIFTVVVSLCTIYYGIFSLMLLTFCAIYCTITQKKLRHLFYYLQYVLTELICVTIIYIPQIVSNKLDPCIEKVNIITRSMGDVELYAGKLIQYILPVSGHRIPALANLKNLYDTSFPLVNENHMVSLGLIMSIGFLTGLLANFFQKETIFKELEPYGKCMLFLFMVSTVGGLGALVGLINYSLRCYNRFSYYIGAVGIIISMKLLQKFCQWLLSRTNIQPFKYTIPYILCMTVLIIGIYDQTTAHMKYTREYGDNLKVQFNNDKKFVNAIESYEGNNANILVFPIMNAQQSATAHTSDGVFTEYREQMLFLHSDTSNWSIGSKAGEAGERWLNWFESFDTKNQIEIAAIVGFSGISVYYGGYSTETLNTLLSELGTILGNPIVINDSNTWAYYSISKIRNELLSDYTDDEIQDLRHKYLYEINRHFIYNSKTLYSTSEYQDENIILTFGTCQYGPYNSFSAGTYIVKIYGNNLNSAKFDCFAKGINYDISIESYSSEYVQYIVIFDTNLDNVEFRTFNETDCNISVEKIEIEKITDK